MADRFVVTKGIDNEFIFTIKQTGNTLPMQIVDNYITETVTGTPGVTYSLGQAYQPAIAAVTAQAYVAPTPYIAASPLVKELYHLFMAGFPDVTGDDSYTYRVIVNDATLAYTYNVTVAASHSDPYQMMEEFATVINGGTSSYVTKTGTLTGNALAAEVDANKLVITAEEEITVNCSADMSIVQLQTYSAAVAGQTYDPGQEAVAEVAAQEYKAYIPPHYTATNSVMTISITDIVPSSEYTITEIAIKPSEEISSIADSTESDGWYILNSTAATSFSVTPVTNEEQLAAPLDEITFTVRFTVTGAADTFVGTFYSLSTNEPVQIEDPDNAGTYIDWNIDLDVIDTNSGRVSLFISAEDTQNLTAVRSTSAADRYYLSPAYKLILDCNTKNNGDFIAKVDEIYVD